MPFKFLHLIITVCLMHCMNFIMAQKYTYLKTIARPGETLYSLFDHYLINLSECNIQQFKKINQLKSASQLVHNKAYLLPIYVCTYDGKSIRSTIKIKSYERATTIKNYNDDLQTKGVRKSGYIDSRILWVPYDILKCPTSNLPLRGTYAIFGKGKERVYLKSEKLAGAVFYIVTGHGGPDPGTIGKRSNRDLCEDEYAYDISLRLTKNLLSHKATAYLIVRDEDDGIRNEQFLKCDKDEYYWNKVAISLDQLERLKKRTEIVNDLFRKNKNNKVYYQRLLSIHIDSRKSDVRKDMYFNYKSANQKSLNLAETLQRVIRNKYKHHQKDRIYSGEASARNLYILDNSLAPSVLVEVGNIKNTVDQLRLVLPENRQAIADWLCEGLIEDFKNGK